MNSMMMEHVRKNANIQVYQLMVYAASLGNPKMVINVLMNALILKFLILISSLNSPHLFVLIFVTKSMSQEFVRKSAQMGLKMLLDFVAILEK